MANQAKSEASKKLLPSGTRWVRVEGGNHAQFGSYGPQPGDGKATISRESQQKVTRETLAKVLQRVSDEAE